MEKETQPLQPQQQEATDILSRAKANSKMLIGASIFVLVVMIAVLAWFFINQNAARRADEALSRANVEQNDSIKLQLYKDAAAMGHKAGHIAALEVATRLYQQKDYKGALEYLKDASFDDNIIASGARTLEGDCYVNLQQYPEAIKAYNKAVKEADKNPAIVPLILIKEANVFRAQGDFEAEYKAYQTILDEYAAFTGNTNYDVRKYYERAKAAAGK